MLNIRRFGTGLQIIPSSNGNTSPSLDGELAVWDSSTGTATYTGTIAGTATPVTISANNTGSTGNTVVLNFDGSTTIAGAIAAWNTANPTNLITLTTGDGTQIPSAAAQVQLTGAGDGNLYFNNGTITYALSSSISSFSTIGNVVTTPGPGEVTATVVSVGSGSPPNIVTASQIVSGVNLANTATSLDSPNSVVLRDTSGNFAAGTITANLIGNVTGNVTGDIVASFATVTDTLDNPNIVFTADFAGSNGNNISLTFNGVQATALDTVDAPNITFTAVNAGTNGNSISLVFDGSTNVGSVVTAWNTANPDNQVGFSGADTAIPTAATYNLAGGSGNTVDSVVMAWNTAHPTNTVSYTGLSTVVPLAHTWNLGGAVSGSAVNVTGIVSPNNGGTGIANANSSTITFPNAFSLTLTETANTSLTLPVSGTLSTLTGIETLSNKTFANAQTWNEVITPITNPPAGSVDVYAKSDNNLYVLNSGGVETPVNSGANPVGGMIMFAGSGVSTYSATVPGTLTPVVINSVKANAGSSITLSFTSTKAAITDTVETPNITFTAVEWGVIGNSISLVFNGTFATVTDTADTPNIVFTALSTGTNGNSISLTFNGTATVQTVVNNWNAAHPTNQVGFSGLGTVVPLANTWNLSGGVGSTVGAVTSAWNTANPSNTVTFTGAGTVIPVAATYTLTGGSGLDISDTITAWNTANPTNMATLISGDGTQTPATGTSITLASQVPGGWLVCDGSAQSKASFSALYAIIGTSFGTGLAATQSVATLTTTADTSSAAFGNIGTNTITADVLGLQGNSITLTFDGVMTVNQVINVWNAANPSNQVTQVGNGANVYPAQSLTLTNGTSTVDGTYFEIYDDSGLVIPWIKIASTTSQPTIPGASRYIQINGIVTSDTSTHIATEIAAALSADSQFTPTTSTSNIVTITNTSFISHTSGNAGNSPFIYMFTNTGGLSTFNLPDLRGIFPRGVDNGAGNDPDTLTRTATNGGNAGDLVGSVQNDGMSDHSHSITFRSGSGSTTPEAPGGGGTYSYSTNGINSIAGSTSATTEVRPKNVYVNYIIKF
jgi:microcystin-dependent protein